MGFFNKYPYLDEHELNLDWLLKRMKELDIRMDEFEVVNHISFSGAWDITKQYPAWTIVSDNNIGYVSIRPVPAGVLLTDGNYWREVIDYTAQIAGLQTRVVALENTVGNASSGLVKDVNDLQTDVSVLQPKVTTLESKVGLLTNKRYIFVSDSYGNVTNNWIARIVNRLGLTTGEWYSTVMPGAGFYPPYNSYFIDYLQAIENTVDSPSTITDIIVVGGFNDRSTTASDLATAISNFVSYCNTQYPNAKVWIGAAGWSFNWEFARELKNGKYFEGYKDCAKYGANALNGMDYIMHYKDNFIEEDPGGYSLYLNKMYVHPNANASDDIASCVITNLIGAKFEYHKDVNATMTLSSGITVLGQNSITMRQILDNDTITISLGNISMAFSSVHAAMNGTQWVEIGSNIDGLIGGAATTDCIPFAGIMQAHMYGGDLGGDRNIPIMLGIMNNRVYISCNTEGHTFQNIWISNAIITCKNIFA